MKKTHITTIMLALTSLLTIIPSGVVVASDASDELLRFAVSQGAIASTCGKYSYSTPLMCGFTCGDTFSASCLVHDTDVTRPTYTTCATSNGGSVTINGNACD